MPKIQVNERDKSWYYRQRRQGPLVVLMPGVSNWGPLEPVLVDESNYVSLIGDAPIKHGEDFSYHMALSFMKAGINVLFWRVNPYTSTPSGGDSGSETTPGEGEGGDDSGNTNLDPEVGGDLTPGTGDGTGTGDSPTIVNPSLMSTSTTTTSTTVTGRAHRNWYGADDNNHIIESGSDGFTITAKYSGTMGNRLSIEMYGKGSVRSVRVYKKDPGRYVSTRQLVETLVYDFTDVYSPYYYKTVNDDSNYIEIVPFGNITNVSPISRNIQKEVEGEWTPVKFYLTGGTDGDITKDDAITFNRDGIIENILNQFNDNDINSVINNLYDPLVYDYDVIVDGGYNDNYDIASSEEDVPSDIDSLWTRVAKKKGTAIYLVSGSSLMDATSFYNYCGIPSSDGTTPVDPPYDQYKDYSEQDTFNTSYAAAFGPWCSCVLTSNGSVRLMPGYYPFLIAWGNSLTQGNPFWMAPAGVKRSNLDGIVKNTAYPVGSAVIDMWQNQNFIISHGSDGSKSGLYSVNPIARLRGYGYTVYGNSTLLKNRYDGATSMLQLFSVRVMSNLIKRQAYDVSLYLQFDQLNVEVFGEFKTLMTVFMDQLKYGKALYDYEISADFSALTLDDINSRTVPVTIRISPTPTAENFIINLEINQAGINFGADDVETAVNNENV